MRLNFARIRTNFSFISTYNRPPSLTTHSPLKAHSAGCEPFCTGFKRNYLSNQGAHGSKGQSHTGSECNGKCHKMNRTLGYCKTRHGCGKSDKSYNNERAVICNLVPYFFLFLLLDEGREYYEISNTNVTHAP